MKKKRMKIGDIMEICLPNGEKVYGRLFKESTLGIFKDKERIRYFFFVAVFSSVLSEPEWPIVEHLPFPTEGEEWAPKRFVKDPITGDYSIYDKGKIVDSSYEECKGLESASVWSKSHLIDRLLGDEKWTDIA